MLDMMLGALIAAAGGIGSLFILLKYGLFTNVRLRSSDGRNLWDEIRRHDAARWIVAEEAVRDRSLPSEWRGVIRLPGRPVMYVHFEERLLRAGFQAKDTVVNVWTMRWNRKRIKRMLDEIDVQDDEHLVNIHVLRSYGLEKIGTASDAGLQDPYAPSSLVDRVSREVQAVMDGDVPKTGILLHGPPGNGKSMFLRWVAIRWHLNIKIVSIDRDYTNFDVISMFSRISQEPSLILMEDFDNMFDLRKPVFEEEAKFTFDSILNVLDGVYCEYRQTVFAITANDLSRIDPAIRDRPSRMRIVEELPNPDRETRMRILGDEELVRESDGMSLDRILAMAEDGRHR